MATVEAQENKSSAILRPATPTWRTGWTLVEIKLQSIQQLAFSRKCFVSLALMKAAKPCREHLHVASSQETLIAWPRHETFPPYERWRVYKPWNTCHLSKALFPRSIKPATKANADTNYIHFTAALQTDNNSWTSVLICQLKNWTMSVKSLWFGCLENPNSE